MSRSELCTRLLALSSFREQLRSVTLKSVVDQFPMLTPHPSVTSAKVDINYALECASVLASGDKREAQDAALRISQFTLNSALSTDGQRSAAALILDVLTNRPALKLALDRNLVSKDFEKEIPGPLRLDAIRRSVEYSILDQQTNELTKVNKFQRLFYRSAEEASWISASAPTSAGKSFILERVVRDAFVNGMAESVVYVVPTRALIQEVELDFRTKLASLTPLPFITSVPHVRDSKIGRTLLIFTQERLHLLLAEDPSFAPDLVVVDEAQKISDSARGVLLEQVLDEICRRKPGVRVVFASPMTSNPEILLRYAPTDSARAVSSEQVAVNQNLLWVSQVRGRPQEWIMELCLDNERAPLGSFKLPFTPAPASKRLPLVAAALSSSGGALVYVNGPAEAETAALLLADYYRDDVAASEGLQALTELAGKVIHQDYALSQTVPAGVAFHYGNMPLIIRSEIERLFRSGELRCLVCTSTLIEGVNLPARSIFVRGPQRGRGKPITPVDFWNLAGRAGRQGKEFQGNVVCIDPGDVSIWKTPPPTERAQYSIVPSTERILRERAQPLVAYIKAGTPRSTTRESDELEAAFGFLMREWVSRRALRGAPRFDDLPLDTVAALEERLDAANSAIELPRELLFRNTGVSPLAQQALLEYLRNRESVEEAIPSDPASNDALESYIRIVGITSKYLSGDPQQLNYPRALLVVSWMRGHPLARLIANAWRYWEPKGKKLPAVIRETMADIEEYARFRFAKYSSCYVDVLRFHLQEQKKPDLVARIPKLSMWLEFGTSIRTQLSLIELGLSRTSAIELSRIIAADDLDVDQVKERLSTLNLDAANLSPIIVREARHALRR